MKIKVGDTRKGVLFSAYFIVLVNFISTWLAKLGVAEWAGDPEVLRLGVGLATGQLVLLVAIQHITARRMGAARSAPPGSDQKCSVSSR